MANGKPSEIYANGAGAVRTSPRDLASAWQLLGLLLLGFLASLAIVELSFLVHKHIQHHRAYRDYILVGAIVAGPILAVYLGFAVRSLVQGAVWLLARLTWWDGLWAVIFLSGLILRKRTANEDIQAPVDSAALFRVCLVAFTGIVLLMRLFLKRTNWLQSLYRGIVGWLTCFSLVAMISTLWSVYWAWTLYKACEYSVDVALLGTVIYMITSEEQFKVFMDWTWALYGLLMLAIWLGVVLDPTAALEKSGAYGVTSIPGLSGIPGIGVWLMGVFPDVASNGVGEIGALLGAIALCRLLPLDRKRHDRAWYSFVLMMMAVTMVLAQTRSAIAGFCLAVFLIYLLSNRIGQGASIVLGGTFLVFVTGLYAYIVNFLSRGQSAQMFSSLSGRLNWWEAALHKFTDYPLTGLGMWAAARFGVLAKIGDQQTATIHSDWIEIIVGTSIWGIIPILVVMGLSWWILLRYFFRYYFVAGPYPTLEAQLAFEAVAVLAVVTVRMCFMTELTLHAPLHFFVPLGYAEWLRRRAQLPVAARPSPST